MAGGDLNGDGIDDLFLGTGPGGSQIKVVDGTKTGLILPSGEISNSALLASFFAFDPAFAGGVFVGGGDIDGDSFDDIIIGSDAGTSAHVKVIDGTKTGMILPNGQISDGALLASFLHSTPASPAAYVWARAT